MKTSSTVKKLKGIIKLAEAEMKKMRTNLKQLIVREAKAAKAAMKKVTSKKKVKKTLKKKQKSRKA
jgi:hypothetical protein